MVVCSLGACCAVLFLLARIWRRFELELSLRRAESFGRVASSSPAHWKGGRLLQTWDPPRGVAAVLGARGAGGPMN